MAVQRNFFLLFYILLFAQKTFAQSNNFPDSIHLSIDNAEKLFLAKNFELLAAKYEVNMAEASVVQAKLWDNPSLSVDQGAYNRQTGKWFDISQTGETAVSVNQLVHLAGQRNKNVRLQKTNSKLASYQFYDLMRTIRYELRINFYALYFLRQSVSVYDQEIASLNILINSYQQQYQKGNIAFKELARLQSLQFNLENERIDLLKDIAEKQSNLVLITGDTLAQTIIPEFTTSSFDEVNASQLNYSLLLDSALANRNDLRIAETQMDAEQANLTLQRSLRVPDLHLGVNYDRAGSYINDYNSVSLGIDLPFFNRNQGNIKAAGYKVEESKLLKNKAELEVKNDVTKAFSQFSESDRLYKSAMPKFTNDYDKLLLGITQGYQNRTISLLEFIDYYETYKNSKTEFNKLQDSRLEAIENINLATGITILK